MKLSFIALSAVAVTTVEGYQPAPSRRAFVHSAATAVLTTATAANAIDACPKGSNNCIRTVWTPPSGTSQADMAKTVQAVLSEYPQVRLHCYFM